jgi:hypothetical protein
VAIQGEQRRVHLVRVEVYPRCRKRLGESFVPQPLQGNPVGKIGALMGAYCIDD